MRTATRAAVIHLEARVMGIATDDTLAFASGNVTRDRRCGRCPRSAARREV